jgi:hypothetical protein
LDAQCGKDTREGYPKPICVFPRPLPYISHHSRRIAPSPVGYFGRIWLWPTIELAEKNVIELMLGQAIFKFHSIDESEKLS